MGLGGADGSLLARLRRDRRPGWGAEGAGLGSPWKGVGWVSPARGDLWSPGPDRNIHLQSLRPQPRTEAGRERKDTAELLGSDRLTPASWPPSDGTSPRRACARHALQAGRFGGARASLADARDAQA